MYINRTYGYISDTEKKLISAGYGKLTVYSLNFDRYVSEEQKEENRKFFDSMTEDQERKYFKSAEFETIQRDYGNALEEVKDLLAGKFNIHQISPETSTMAHYRTNWDLFFWSDRGWNGKDYMSQFRLNFNDDRTAEQNMELLEVIISMLESVENQKVGCMIQYDAWIDMEKVESAAWYAYEGLKDSFLPMFGCTGKIKIVSEDNNRTEYGFFKKGAKRKYIPISTMDLAEMTL